MRVSEIDVVTPATLTQCLQLLSRQDGERRLLAGGTDAVVRMKEGKWRPRQWVSIRHLQELRYIREAADGIHVGPLTTHSDIVRSPLLRARADVLAQAAAEVGATQIRNIGTIGGNLATASPAGDTLPALYVLDARVQLTSVDGQRLVEVSPFYLGPGRADIRPGEMITDILLSPQADNEIGHFEKLGPRKAQAISIVNAAVSLRMERGSRRCERARVAFGSVGPTILRATQCEKLLTEYPLTDEIIENVSQLAWKHVAPISDLRASANYRRDMAAALLQRALYRLMKRWDAS